MAEPSLPVDSFLLSARVWPSRHDIEADNTGPAHDFSAVGILVPSAALTQQSSKIRRHLVPVQATPALLPQQHPTLCTEMREQAHGPCTITLWLELAGLVIWSLA